MSTEPRLTAFGPDFPFDFASWLAHPAGVAELPPDAAGKEVAIIGAGIAGVVTGYELMKLGLSPVLYEIGRIGGRLRSEPFDAAPHIVAELGGMRFPTSGSMLWHYIDLVGLEGRDFPNPLTPAAPTTVIELAGEKHFARSQEDLPRLFQEVLGAWDDSLEQTVQLSALQDAMRRRDPAAVKRLWDPIVEAWDDRTFYDFVATSEAFGKLTYRHREVFGQVGFGTGGWDADFPNSMLEILRVVAAGFEDDQKFIVGGSEQIPRRLWSHAPEDIRGHPVGTSLASLHAGSTRPGVTAVWREPNGRIGVTDRWGITKVYDAVLFSVQSWLLTTAIKVDEALFSQKVWMALDRTRYMQSSKTFVMVDEPFWRTQAKEGQPPPLSMTLTDRSTRGTYLIDNGDDQPAVIVLSYAWAGDAMKVLPMDAAQRAELALETLAEIYPETDIRRHIIGEPISVSWEADPHFLGAFKGALPGHYRYNRRMHSHFIQDHFPAAQRGVFLAGDDVSWTPGWAEGAVHTALNAVWGIVHHLGGTSHPDNPGPGDLYPTIGPVELPDP